MTDSRFGDSKVFYQFIKPFPIVALALWVPIQPLEKSLRNTINKAA